jgi:hypothetical protein
VSITLNNTTLPTTSDWYTFDISSRVFAIPATSPYVTARYVLVGSSGALGQAVEIDAASSFILPDLFSATSAGLVPQQPAGAAGKATLLDTGGFGVLHEAGVKPGYTDSDISTSYTVDQNDRGTVRRFTSGSAVTVTVPNSTPTDWQVGMKFRAIRGGRRHPHGGGGRRRNHPVEERWRRSHSPERLRRHHVGRCRRLAAHRRHLAREIPMRKLLLAAVLLAGLAAPAFSCDLTAGPGAVVRYSEGQTGGLFTMGCVFSSKWELRAYWIGEQRIYRGRVVIDGYPAISASKIWRFREGRKFSPIFSLGVLAKGAQRCHYDGDVDCNRMMPLPFAFLTTVGVKWGDVLITLGHASNSSLDHGEEKKNLGLDHLRAEVWF